MNQILDLEDQKIKQVSWKIGIITNLVLGILFFLLFCFESVDRTNKVEWLQAMILTFALLSFINLVVSPISLFFSKRYWQKWLIMAALLFAGMFVVVVVQSYVDVQKQMKERIHVKTRE